MDHKVFIDLVLEPLFKYDVPRLYPGEEEKVIHHMDSASAHVYEKTVKWLNERKIKFISKEEWMANSPDLSPMDYSVNSIFKGICNRHEAKNMQQLATIAKRVWNNFGQGYIYRTMLAWPKRVDKMVEALGYQIKKIL